MNVIEQLERLNRLRESGVLTSDEFSTQKMALLNRESNDSGSHYIRFSIPLSISIVIVSLIIAGIIFYYWIESTSGQYVAQNKTLVPSIATVNNSVNASSAASNPEREAESRLGAATYAWATSADVIRANPAFLEARLGPAREKSEFDWRFDVESCEVRYRFRAGAVSAMEAAVTPRCRPSLAGTLASGTPISTSTTFGAITRQAGRGRYFISCMGLCGNATEPDLIYMTGGSHADNYNYVAFVSSDSNEQTFNASTAWSNALRQENIQAEPGTQTYECVQNPPDIVRSLLSRVHIQRVIITDSDQDVFNWYGCNN